MLEKFILYIKRLQNASRVSLALSRAAATSALRTVDPTRPITWEFCGFSQNGEDGIIDFLTRQIKNPNRYFVEIGASDGWENNTSWLAIGRKFSGVMIEGNEKIAKRGLRMVGEHNLGVEFLNLFVTKENVNGLANQVLFQDCDVFSLDIDGNDYYLVQTLFEAGFRPKIFVVEYNSAFGPDLPITIEYARNFNYLTAHQTQLYYGASIAAWKKIFHEKGYRFVTVDSNGVNGFFIDPRHFDEPFVENIRGLSFQENFFQFKKFKTAWGKQFAMIKDMRFMEIK